MTDQKLLTGAEARRLGVGAVVRWVRDRTAGGLRMHTPTQGWVPPVDGSERQHYVLVTPAFDGPPAPKPTDKLLRVTCEERDEETDPPEGVVECPRCERSVPVEEGAVAEHGGRYVSETCDGSGVEVETARALAR